MLQQGRAHLERVAARQLNGIPKRLFIHKKGFISFAQLRQQAPFHVVLLLCLPGPPFDLAVGKGHDALVLLLECLLEIRQPVAELCQPFLSRLLPSERFQFLAFRLFVFNKLLLVFFADNFVEAFADGHVDQER